MTQTDTKGHLPGGEDRTQWIFEGEWAEEEMAPCIALLTQYIEEYRAKLGFDMVAFFRFSHAPFYSEGSNIERLYFVTRRGWLYSHMGTTIEEMLGKLHANLYG